MSTQTILVTFGASSGTDPYYLTELDASLNLDSEGNEKTSFAVGDTIWFLLHLQPGWQPGRVTQSNGQASFSGQVIQTRTDERLVYSPSNSTNDLRYYPAGSLTLDWLGNAVPVQRGSGRSLAAVTTPTVAALLNCSYPARFYRYRYTTPAGLVLAEDTDYPVLVEIDLEATV